MKIETLLKELGLKDQEPEIYLTLIKTPGIHPASIIAGKLNMNRTTVYKNLVKLAKMGLVTKTIKHGITCFFAEDPEERIEGLLKKKRQRMEYASALFNDVIPELKTLEKRELLVPQMRYYEGIEGAKRVYADTLIEEETIYAFIATRGIPDELLDFLENDYLPKRVEKDIFAYVIAPKTKINKDFKKSDQASKRMTRFLPNVKIPHVAIEINIYGKKTAFISHKEGEYFGIIIENDSLTQSMKGMFDICWDASEKN